MVNTEVRRRRLSVQDRREELTRACLQLIGTKPWDEVSMADVALAAGVSKPLLYHYFSTKSDLYHAAVRSAADELREATRPDPGLPPGPRLLKALGAHIDWIDANATAYRAILQGGISSDDDVQAIVEESRAEVVSRLADSLGFSSLTSPQRIALRGWVGFLESACIAWLIARDISKAHLARLLAASVSGALRAAEVDADATDAKKPTRAVVRRPTAS
jgi:AcrR family transcriptional regulator